MSFQRTTAHIRCGRCKDVIEGGECNNCGASFEHGDVVFCNAPFHMCSECMDEIKDEIEEGE